MSCYYIIVKKAFTLQFLFISLINDSQNNKEFLVPLFAYYLLLFLKKFYFDFFFIFLYSFVDVKNNQFSGALSNCEIVPTTR